MAWNRIAKLGVIAALAIGGLWAVNVLGLNGQVILEIINQAMEPAQ